MRAENINKGTPINNEHMPAERHRICEEEFEMWGQESCLASAD